MSKLLQPFLEDTIRGKNMQCEICRKKFNIFNRVEHKCKRCYRSVCVSCAPQRTRTYKQDGTAKDHRVCKKCMAENRLILKYFEDKKLKFGTESEFCTTWMKRLYKERTPYSGIMADYSKDLSESNESIQKFKRESSIIFQDLHTSYNYSIRYFFELTKGDTPSKQVEESILNVMVSVFGKIGSLSYFPEMVYLAAFFLCFSSECYAYMIITGLLDKVYPQYQTIFRPKRDNMLIKEVKSIVTMIQQLIDPSEKDIMPEIKRYLDSQANKMLNTLTINFCNFEVTLHLIHETLQKGSYLELYKGVASLVYLSKEMITRRVPYDQVERFILKSITLQNVKAQMCRLERIQVQSVTNRHQSESISIIHSNPTNQKVATLQKMITLIETQLLKRTEQLTETKIKCMEYQREIDDQRKLTGNLKQQLCLLGSRLQQIHQYQQIKAKYQASSDTIHQLEIVNRKARNEINLLLAKQHEYQNQIQQFRFVYEVDEDCLVKLQTENEVLRLKLEAKEIGFETDHFEGQILDKNRKIMNLQEEMESATIKIKYLEKSITEMEEQLSFKIPLASESKTQESSTDNLDQLKEYKQQIDLSIITLRRQKQRLDQMQTHSKKSEETIRGLQSTNETLEKERNMLKQKLEEMMKLETAPREQDQSLIQLIDKEISRQDNIMRKSDFQRIKNRVKHYQHEIKIKDLDLRLKSNKIEEIMNQKMESQVVEMAPLVLQILDEEVLNNNRSENKQKEDCLLF